VSDSGVSPIDLGSGAGQKRNPIEADAQRDSKKRKITPSPKSTIDSLSPARHVVSPVAEELGGLPPVDLVQCFVGDCNDEFLKIGGTKKAPRYNKQCLAVLQMGVTTNDDMLGNTPNPSSAQKRLASINGLMVIGRNPIAQIYRIPGLSRCLHGSVGEKELHRLKGILPASIPVQTVGRDKNYKTPTGYVINGSDDDLKLCSVQLASIFNQSLGCFVLDQSSKGRHLATFSGGYTMQVAQEYKSNRSTIIGNCKPFLIPTSHQRMAPAALKSLAELIASLIKKTSYKGMFAPATDDAGTERRHMHKEFAKSMNMVEDDDLFDWFRAEGFSLVLNELVCWHADSSNDTSPGFDETLSVNTSVPVTQEMLDHPSFKHIMGNLGKGKVGGSLSISLMVYSRKCVGDYIKKRRTILELVQNPSASNKFIAPILSALERVQSVVNYGQIWDNAEVHRSMATDLIAKPLTEYKTRKLPTGGNIGYKAPRQYNGKFQKIRASFDKMVRTCGAISCS